MSNGVLMVKTNVKRSPVVCDAGPVIHLDELGCLWLLQDFKEILLPHTVWKEISLYRPESLDKPRIPFIIRPCASPVDEQLITMCRMFSLHPGEIDALAHMKQNPQAILLTDDAAARLVALRMGFNVHGTIGILIRSIRRGQMKPEDVVDIIAQIPVISTLHIKPSLLEEISHEISVKFSVNR